MLVAIMFLNHYYLVILIEVAVVLLSTVLSAGQTLVLFRLLRCQIWGFHLRGMACRSVGSEMWRAVVSKPNLTPVKAGMEIWDPKL